MEKIKISIPKYTYEILTKDCELFEILKTDGTLNKNEFLNTLIKNYYQEFTATNTELKSAISKSLSKYHSFDEFDQNDLSNDIISIINKFNNKYYDNKDTITISVKPTRSTTRIFTYIQDNIIQNQSISSFYRDLFNSYVSLVQTKRERIIFKETVDTINEAIESNRQVYFHTAKSKNAITASVYCIANSKEELFNYVLTESKGKITSYRLSRIKDIALVNEVRTIEKSNKEIYDKLIDYGPQYIISNKEEKVKIQLTPEGEKLYQKIYLYRPKYIEKDGNIYTFDCSYNQILFYFARLGKEAVILEPKTLRTKMRFAHKDAYVAYTDNNKKHD